MKMYIFLALAFIGGVCLAIQGGFNARLGVVLKNPVMAVLVASICSALFSLIYLIARGELSSLKETAATVPFHLWFSGGLFSAVGISLYYFTMPKLGVSSMIALGLAGQLIFATVAGRLGWFQMPVEMLSVKRIIGVLAILSGIFLLNR